MSQTEREKFGERIELEESYTISAFSILKKHCPLTTRKKLTGNESFDSIILRFINYFTLYTLTSESQESIHTEEIKEIFKTAIDSNTLKIICRDELLVNIIRDLDAHRIDPVEIFRLLTKDISDLPEALKNRKDEIIDSFKYIDDKVARDLPTYFHLKYLKVLLTSESAKEPVEEHALNPKPELMKLYPNDEVINKDVNNKCLDSIFYKLIVQKLHPEIFLDVLANPESKFFVEEIIGETPTRKHNEMIKKKLTFENSVLDTITNKLENLAIANST